MKIFQKTKSEDKRFTKDFNSAIRNVMFNSLGFFFLEFIIPIYASQELNATGIQIGLLFSVQTIGSIISNLFIGYLTDRVNSRTSLILIGSFGRGSAYFIVYTAIIIGSIFFMGLGTFFIGFFAGIFWTPFDTIISEKSNKNNRSQAFGRRDSAVGVGLFIGALIGFTNLGIGLNFFPTNLFLTYFSILIYGISNFFAGFQFYSKVVESIKFTQIDELNSFYPEEEKINKKRLLQSSFLFGFSFLCFVLLLGSINGSLAKPFFNIYVVERIVNNTTVAMFAYIPSGIVAMFLAPKLGKLIDRIKPQYGISIISTLGAFITWGLISTNNFFIFTILLTFDTAVVNISKLLIQNIFSRISIGHRGKMISFYRFFMSAGFILGPIFGGFSVDFFNLKAPFIISIIVELSLVPFYLISIYLIKPNLAEKFTEKTQFLEKKEEIL